MYKNIDLDMLPEFLFMRPKEIRTESDISKSVRPSTSDFPVMKKDFEFERYLNMLLDLDSDNIDNENLKLLKTKSSTKSPILEPKDCLNSSMINLITMAHRPFRDQLLYISSNFTSYLINTPVRTGSFQNTRSMPMKYESLSSLNLNYPLIPDNHNYYRIFEILQPKHILDIFMGILMEERILVILEEVDEFSLVLEALFELLFPLNPVSYMTIPSLGEGMEVFLGSPCTFIFGCRPDIFEKLQKYHLKDYEEELMIIDIENDRIHWDRRVKYPQPHAQYFLNTLTMIKQSMPNSSIKLTRSLSVANSDEEQLLALKKYIQDNLHIKQAFVNFILCLLNNFLSYENFKYTDSSKKIKELVFDDKAYLKSIQPEFYGFYERIFQTVMFTSFLKEKNNDSTSIRAKEFMKYYNIAFKRTKIQHRDRDSLDLLKSCSENYTDVIDSTKFSGAEFIQDEKHHVIQLNKLKYKQNNQIERLLNAIEEQYNYKSKQIEISQSNESKGCFTNTKFLSDTARSGNQNQQKQSVISVLLDKPHFVKVMNSKLFNKVALEDYMTQPGHLSPSEIANNHWSISHLCKARTAIYIEISQLQNDSFVRIEAAKVPKKEKLTDINQVQVSFNRNRSLLSSDTLNKSPAKLVQS